MAVLKPDFGVMPRTERIFELKLAIALPAYSDRFEGFAQQHADANLRTRGHHQVGVHRTSLNAAAGSWQRLWDSFAGKMHSSFAGWRWCLEIFPQGARARATFYSPTASTAHGRVCARWVFFVS